MWTECNTLSVRCLNIDNDNKYFKDQMNIILFTQDPFSY